ncbi:MAG: dihydroxyacetone kinase subunit L [Proteobacteria bacterium]|nr:dihydroxyacetone kinase subunit L [Pseudomonadota bacterium]
MAPEVICRFIDAAAAAIREHAAQLTELDRAIGDGDHGLNMQRGFDAVAEARDEICGLPLPDALQKIGMTLVMKIGGAAGPLYGSLFLAMGKAAPESLAGVAEAAMVLQAGINGVKRRGKSEAGEKTMLDVLVPVTEALEAAAAEGAAPVVLPARLREAADRGLESTRAMRATKGRASFLGARSVGHIDPGARSSQILVNCVCDIAAALSDDRAAPA